MAEVTEAVTCVALTKAVVSELPFHCTAVLPETKFVPLTVSVKVAPPGAADAGLRLEIVGATMVWLTFTVTCIVDRPYWFVAFNVYVVVVAGVVVTLPPCTPPSTSMKSYESLLVFHESVTGVPGATVEADAVKLLIVGGCPVGAVTAS
jgi:hypothetical protein